MKISDLIADTGLRMAALDRLLEAEIIDTEALTAAAAEGVARVQANDEFWFEEDGERRIAVDECRDELLALFVAALGEVEVEPEALRTITSLDFDGGNEIYMWLEASAAELLGLEDWELDTGGESELYVVESFAGIASLTELEALHLDAYGFTDLARDAAPLAKLAKLATLDLADTKLSDDAVLTKLPALRKLSGTRSIDASVVEALRAAGVEIG